MSQQAPDPIDAMAHEQGVAEFARRWAQLQQRIAAVTDRDVRVIAVSKGHDPAAVDMARAAGVVAFGESYAQELRAKNDRLVGRADADVSDVVADPIEWHFVGRLQRNKVRLVSDVVSWWHTVDSARLAAEVARRAPGATVMVQVDLAGLPGRGGADPSEVPDVVARCGELGLSVRGLMGVGPPGAADLARPGFRLLSTLADRLGLEERCIGMSGDLEVAVAEGSTMVRVGTDLFGRRPST